MPLFIAIATLMWSLPAISQGEIAFMRDGCVWVLDVETGAERRIAEAQYDRPVTWSPDGTHLLWWDHRSGGWDLWRRDADGSNPANLTPETTGGCRSPSFSPDGSRIAFMRDDPAGLWIMNADGSDMRQLSERGHRDVPPQWSPDGARLLYGDLEERDDGDLAMIIRLFDLASNDDRSLAKGDEAQWISDAQFIYFGRAQGERVIRSASINNAGTIASDDVFVHGTSPALSADRSRIAFARAAAGTIEIRTIDIATRSEQLLCAREDASAEVLLRWSPDGSQIVIWEAGDEDADLSIVDASTGAESHLFHGVFAFPAWRPGGLSR